MIMLNNIQLKILTTMDNTSFDKLSFRKIGDLIGLTHPQSVIYHLQRLEILGYLQIDWKNKTFKKIKDVTQPECLDKTISLPILGSANCGLAMIYAEQQMEEHLKISRSMLHGLSTKELFAVKADGDSMNRANIDGDSIENGDYVIISRNYSYLKNGDYVLSIIDNMANIKKFFRDNEGNILLLSESNKNYPPIYITPDDSKYLVNGKVVKVIKIGKNMK